MLVKPKIAGCLLHSCIRQTIRSVSNTKVPEFEGKLDLEHTLNVIEEKKKSTSLAFSSLSDHDLQEIHNAESGDVDDEMIAHKEYANYCRKNPQAVIRVDNQHEKLTKFLSPLHSVEDYYGQLMIKRQIFIKPLNYLQIFLQKRDCYLRPLTRKPNFMCDVEPIRYLENKPAYRNFSDLTVNVGIDGEFNTVGYMLPNPETNDLVCVTPLEHPDTKKSHRIIAMFFQDFIRHNFLELNSAPWRVWKGIIIKSTEFRRKNMAIVKVSFCVSEEDRTKIKEALSTFFFLGQMKEHCNISSLYIQFGNDPDKCELVKGKPNILEKVNGVKYEIGPNTAFPANSAAVDLLIEAIGDAYKLDSSSVVLQMGCHSNYAMQLSKHARNVICIEWRRSLLAAGKRHAELNFLKNVDFHFCKNDAEVDKSLDDPNANFVAVVHSINGFNQRILYCLRKNPSVKAVILIYHNHAHVRHVLNALCSNRIPDWHPLSIVSPAPERFSPCKIIPLDMLPNTTITQFVMTLKREFGLRRKKPTEEENKQFYSFTDKHKFHEVYKNDRPIDIEELDEDDAYGGE